MTYHVYLSVRRDYGPMAHTFMEINEKVVDSITNKKHDDAAAVAISDELLFAFLQTIKIINKPAKKLRSKK